MREFRILSPTAILGYGFPLASFQAGLAKKPHLIAVDAGSTDPGPYYLGEGVSFTDRQAVKRDLALMLKAGIQNKIPVIVGSAGGSGADSHLAWCRAIVDEIARDEQLSFTMAVIHAEFKPETVLEALREGRIRPLDPAAPLNEDLVTSSSRIVGQMGVEAFVRALADHPDVILAGRSYDPAVFAALPIRLGFDPGLALHLGKILECAAICATPGSGSDAMFGTLYEDHFLVEPLNPDRACTPLSVAAHTLYEKSNPSLLPGPGGRLNLNEARFDAVSDRIVRVSGSRFEPSARYTVKLEGARPIGYRTVSIAGVRDPFMIRAIDSVIAGVRARVADNFAELAGRYRLLFHVYGRDGVMGPLEPAPGLDGAHELGLLIEATADTQAQADTICGFARSTMLHFGYPGRRATAGNLAFPYSPSDLHAGRAYVFSLYHLLEVDDPAGPFACEWVRCGEGQPCV